MKDEFICTKAEDGFYIYSIGNGAEQIFSNYKLSEEELSKKSEEFNKAIGYHVEQISEEINKRIFEREKIKHDAARRI